MGVGDSNFDSSGTAPIGVPAEFAGIPEDALLAWIEGELSPLEVSALAERHPAAVPLIASMRRDRASLASVVGAQGLSAPADLAGRVMAAVEREALLGLSQGELVSDSLPISQVPKKKTARQIWWQQATPRLALAAGLTMVISAGAIFALRGKDKPQRPVGPVAINDVEAPSPDVTPAMRSFGAIAENNADAVHSKMSGTVEKDNADGMGAPAPAALAAATTIDADKAALLASEGRLVLRARGASIAVAARLDSPRARVSSVWNVREELAPTTVAMLAPPAPAIKPSTVHPLTDFAAMVAAEFATGAHEGESAPVSINPLLLAPQSLETLPSVPMSKGSVLDVRADGASIEAAREQLSKLLGLAVEFEESPEPISVAAPAASADSVLWWTQPPKAWAPRVRVPLIVELR